MTSATRSERYGTLPEGPDLAQAVQVVDTRPLPDPLAGQNPDLRLALEDD